MTPEGNQATAKPKEKPPQEAPRRGVRVARPFVWAYFVLFYNTNFVLNVTLSLTVLLPLLAAERLAGTVGGAQLLQQIAAAIYLSLLYGVVYVVNDLVDYRNDIRQHPFKVSLLTQTGSRYGPIVFGLWLSVTLATVISFWPSRGLLYLAYTFLLVAVAALHSYFPGLKPVTIFIERYVRVLAPPFIIYSMMPTAMTSAFLLSIMLVYPAIMDGAYKRYLETKLAWNRGFRRWSLSLYAFYYGVWVIGVFVWSSLGAYHPPPDQGHRQAVVMALLLAPLLFAVYAGYERAVRLLSDLVPARVVPGGNPAFPGERKQAACELLVICALIGLLAVSA